VALTRHRADSAGVRLLVAAALERRALVAVGAITAAIPLGLLGLSLVAASVVGLGLVSFAFIVAHNMRRPELVSRIYGPLGPPLKPVVGVDQLPLEVSAGYADLLASHERIRRRLDECPGLVTPLLNVYVRLGELVDCAGRVAASSRRLDSYLNSENPDNLAAEQLRLDACGQATTDEVASDIFHQAARARGQQLSTYREIEGLYDRVLARLSVVTSTLAMIEALIIKLDALDHDQVESTGRILATKVDEAEQELELLSASLEAALS
jgi:hypothetical protein